MSLSHLDKIANVLAVILALICLAMGTAFFVALVGFASKLLAAIGGAL